MAAQVDGIVYFRWCEEIYGFTSCDPDHPDAEPFEWDEDAFEWVYVGKDE